jgi:hypothetical protein
MEANVLLCKCTRKHTFGIRVEKRGNDWIRTWAFKIDEERAQHEGFDKVNISGSFEAADEYPGCPYCGEKGIAHCSCGKLNCFSGMEDNANGSGTLTCNWCGVKGVYNNADSLEVKAGGV